MRFFGASACPAKPLRQHKVLIVELLEDRTLMSASLAPEIQLLATPNDPRFASGSLYGMTKINAPTAWNTTTGSMKIVVADIDTGIDYTHPDLYLNVWLNQGEIPVALRDRLVDTDADGLITFRDLNAAANAEWVANLNGNSYIDAGDLLLSKAWEDGVDTDGNGYRDDLVGWDFVNNDNDPFDDNGHGTHTAGTIGAIGNNGTGVVGVNWQVQIMALKILSATGGGNLLDAAEAITYSGRNGARVSNNSWGFSDRDETVNGTEYTYLYNAIKNTPQVLFVAAAGNNGVNNDTSGSRNFPASYNLPNIISVAATDSKDRKASFSAYGKTTVDLGAPGVNIVSTVPGGGYASFSGTSMATPHVAGAAALILAKNATLSPAAVKSALLGSVTKVGAMSQTVSGGRLNLAGAQNSVPFIQGTVIGGGIITTTSGSVLGGRILARAAGLGVLGTASFVVGQTDSSAIGSAFRVSTFGSDFRGDARFGLNENRIASVVTLVPTFAVDTPPVQPLPTAASAQTSFALSQSFGAGVDAEPMEQMDQNEMNPDRERPEPAPRRLMSSSMPRSLMTDELTTSESSAPVIVAGTDGPVIFVPPEPARIANQPAVEPAARGFVGKSLANVLGLAAAFAFFAQGAFLGRSRLADEQQENRSQIA